MLEKKLLHLQTYGEPTLAFNAAMKPGWYCTLKIHQRGAEIMVRSGYDCATPTEAVDRCTANLNALRNNAPSGNELTTS